MSTFPVLNSGAMLQFPASRTLSFSTTIVRFVDGREQRYPLYTKPVHRWAIQLDALGDDEMQRLISFVEAVGGPVGTFSFTDPWDGVVYPSCSIEGQDTDAQFHDAMKAKTRIIVRENLG